MAIETFMVINNELLNKDPDMFPEKAPIIILDIKSAICVDKIVKDTKHTRHISRRINFVRNGEERNFHKTVWCEVVLKMEDIGTKNVRENGFNRILVYAMGRI